MLKVFLVEDEIVMREGIKNNIDWEAEGFEFAGEASDGELAFPLIRRTKPDILITDIKMPFMDGLELSRLVKKELPDTSIIVLSGYNEFDYAKEAIQIGITNYLLKPITSAQLIEEIHQVEKKILAEREKELDVKSLNVTQTQRNRLEKFISTGLTSEIDTFLEDYFEKIGKKNIQSVMFRQYVAMDIFMIVRSAVHELGYSKEEINEFLGEEQSPAQVLSSVGAMKEYFKNMLRTAIELREKAAGNKYGAILRDAQGYIQEHYQEEDISLNVVAASVNLSPNHFSRIFAQELGVTFIEYLTNVRMEEAKKLLRTTQMKTTDIAFAVGYHDPHYFSNQFKKTQNCTPREYRSMN